MIENEIINKAIEYILLHIWDNISAEEVADYCHLSKFYFNRLFKENTGSSVYAFIKKTKMEQSALRIKLENKRSISDIGLDYGYSSSNFSSAFSQYHKKSPTVFRQETSENIKNSSDRFEEYDKIIRIENIKDYRIMYERTIGNYYDMRFVWCDFVENHKTEVTKDTVFFEKTYDDPAITNEDECIYDICMSIGEDAEYENISIIEGGKFAVCPFKGYIEEIKEFHKGLMEIWFPMSEYEIDERYSYDRYYRADMDGYLEFDICIPIK